jgi:hypothetical protein
MAHIDLTAIITAIITALIATLPALSVFLVKEIRSHQKDNVYAAGMGKALDTIQTFAPAAKVVLDVAEVLDPKLRTVVQKVKPIAAPILQAVLTVPKEAPAGGIVEPVSVVLAPAAPSHASVLPDTTDPASMAGG